MSGTMRERPPGSMRWELRAYVGRDPETGRPRQVSRTFHGGKREARRALDSLVSQVAAGTVKVGTTATVGRLLDEWMARYVERHRARATIETYRVHVEKYLKPGLGHIRLSKLDAYVLDRYFEDLERVAKLAPSTVRLDHAILSGALSQAVDWGWIEANPAKRARLRAVRKPAAPALTVEQVRDLYWAATEVDPDMATAIAMAALTGCRRGELLGLRWDDLDWERGSLRVERQWVPGAGGQHLEDATKTGGGRTVFVGAEGLAILQRYWDEKRALIGRDPDGWLLSYDGETPLRAKSLTEFVTRVGKKLGIPVHLHALRHFAATELVHAGVDLPTAAGFLGHSPEVMAATYLHSRPERGAAAGALLSGIVGAALGAAPRPAASGDTA